MEIKDSFDFSLIKVTMSFEDYKEASGSKPDKHGCYFTLDTCSGGHVASVFYDKFKLIGTVTLTFMHDVTCHQFDTTITYSDFTDLAYHQGWKLWEPTIEFDPDWESKGEPVTVETKENPND